VKKNGKQKRIQRYFCPKCKTSFSARRREKRREEEIWSEYVVRKQTQKEIGKKFGKSRVWVNRELAKSPIPIRGKNDNIFPQKIVLVLDTTYFNDFGVMVFRDANTRKNLLWFTVSHETNEKYRDGILELMHDGFEITAIVADGKPGLSKLFPEIPFQMCHFHQMQRVTQLISKKPKLFAGKEFRSIILLLPRTDRASFEYFLDKWHQKWREFLAEKTIGTDGKSRFTHDRIRRAYFSVKRNLPLLFTFEKHFPEIKIPNTTNTIESFFSHWEDKMAIHRGMSRDMRLRVIARLVFL